MHIHAKGLERAGCKLQIKPLRSQACIELASSGQKRGLTFQHGAVDQAFGKALQWWPSHRYESLRF